MKSEKVALMNSNETRNSCIYIRFCSLVVFVLWAQVIGSVGYRGCASWLLQCMCVASTPTATVLQNEAATSYLGRIIVFCVTENLAHTSKFTYVIGLQVLYARYQM